MPRRKTDADATPVAVDRHAKFLGLDVLARMKSAKASSRSKSALEAEILELRTLFINATERNDELEKSLRRAEARAEEMSFELEAWRAKYVGEFTRRTDLEGELKKVHFRLQQAGQEKVKVDKAVEVNGLTEKAKSANSRAGELSHTGTLRPRPPADVVRDQDNRHEEWESEGRRSLRDVFSSDEESGYGEKSERSASERNLREHDQSSMRVQLAVSSTTEERERAGTDSLPVLSSVKRQLHRRKGSFGATRKSTPGVKFADEVGVKFGAPLQKVARRITQIGTFQKARRQSVLLIAQTMAEQQKSQEESNRERLPSDKDKSDKNALLRDTSDEGDLSSEASYETPVKDKFFDSSAASLPSPSASPIIGVHDLKERFFEHFVIVGVPPAVTPTQKLASIPPSILVHFPANKKLDHPELPMFVFPGQVPLKSLPRRNSESSIKEILFSSMKEERDDRCHMFVLNGDEILYGICMFQDEVVQLSQGIARVAPKGYCFISKFPFSEVHLRVLTTIMARLRFSRLQRVSLSKQISGENGSEESKMPAKAATPPAGKTATPPASPKRSASEGRSETGKSQRTITVDAAAAALLESLDENAKQLPYDPSLVGVDSFLEVDFMKALNIILSTYYAMPLPPPATTMSLPCLPGSPYMNDTRTFSRPPATIPEVVPLLGRWGLPACLRVLPFSTIEKIISAALVEKNIIFVSSNLALLSSVSLVIPPLLHPLSWQSAYIPILPSTLIDFVQSPVPFIVGVVDLPSDVEPSEGTLVVDLMKNSITFNGRPVAEEEWPADLPKLPRDSK